MNPALFPQLHAVLAVARLRSFTSAARELGVSRSAVSQAVRQLEEQLRVVLLARTTRSFSLTDAGRRLMGSAGPGLEQALAALTEVSAKPGEAVGRLRLTMPRTAVPFAIDPVVPAFRARHPRVEIEIAIEERLVDIVEEGFDAGVRESEAIERDMVQLRLTDPFRFLVVGTPSSTSRAARSGPRRSDSSSRWRGSWRCAPAEGSAGPVGRLRGGGLLRARVPSATPRPSPTAIPCHPGTRRSA